MTMIITAYPKFLIMNRGVISPIFARNSTSVGSWNVMPEREHQPQVPGERRLDARHERHEIRAVAGEEFPDDREHHVVRKCRATNEEDGSHQHERDGELLLLGVQARRDEQPHL